MLGDDGAGFGRPHERLRVDIAGVDPGDDSGLQFIDTGEDPAPEGALLTERDLRRGVFGSVAELEKAIHAYIVATNADPKPFRWTKTADDILASVQRFCLRTLAAKAQNEKDFRFRTLGGVETSQQLSPMQSPQSVR